MKVTLIYDNESFKEGLQGDWGFSCLVEVENTPKILFDTGANGAILLSNMEKLKIDPASIQDIVISHAHFDHVGGLSAFLNVNSDVSIYVPASIGRGRSEKGLISVDGPMEIYENVFSTGELDNIEQSMAVKTDDGVVVIAGCSHPGMARILDAASRFGKVYAVVGGLHGFCEYDLFKDLKMICPTHCTQHKQEIKSLYPDRYVQGGAGQVIVI
jgi:7,8-dihydropterin-6-yl-methyl-4-(beta-D-ribofuranosyl)aminobenzene 5'-phosphate synthase